MDTLKFNYNWNNKLNCKCFSTIRLHNDKKYFIGNEFEYYLKDVLQGKIVVVYVSDFELASLSEAMARIDTSYSKAECIKLILTMYKNKKIDWEKQYLSFIILQKI